MHEQPAVGNREPGSMMGRAIAIVMRSWFASAQGRFALAACCMTFLTYLLLSEDPWWLFRSFPKETVRTLKHGVVDKVYHFVAYFGTTCILMWYAVSGTRRTMSLLAAAVTVHAVVTEFLQQFVPRRTTDMDDLFANLAGIAAGVCVGIQLRRMLTGSGTIAAVADFKREAWTAPEPGVSTRRAVKQVVSRAVQVAKPRPTMTNTRPEVVSADRTSFGRLQLSSDQIAEVQPRQLNYRLLGIVTGVVGLMLVSTYAVHGWQVRRVAGSSLQNARQAKEAGDVGVALNFFEQYCSSSPNDVNALAEFAILSDDARTRPNGGKGVFMLFERVLRKDQTRDDIRRRLVVTAIELGRYSDALSHVKVLQQTYPKEGLFDFQAGVCQEKLGNHIAAAEAFQAAIDDSPEMIEPWERLAWLKHSKSAKTEEAEQLMLRLVQVNSQEPAAWIARAKFRVRTKQPEEAGLDIDRALKIAPNEFQVLYAAGEVGIARARQARADDRLPKARRIAIETETLLAREDQSKADQRRLDLQRVILAAEFGDVKKAFALAATLLEDSAAEDRIEIHQLMAEIAIGHEHFNQARDSLDQLPRTEITDGQRLRLEAGVAMSDQRWRAAADSLEEARRILAESPEQLQKVDLKLAECFGRIGQVEDRLVAYRRVLKYSPQSVEARRGLASTLATAKRYPEALAEYRQLVHIPAVRLELVRHLIDYNATVPEVARDWKEVTELLSAARTDGGSLLDVTMLSAEMLILKREFDDARRLVAQIHDDFPGDSDVLALQIQIAELSGDPQEASRLKGETLASNGQVEDAERQLRNTLLESEENGEAAISLMKLYLRNDRAEQAVEVFRQHAPRMTTLQLSRTYEAFGDLQRAIGVLQQYVDQQSDDTAAVQQLADLYLRNGRQELAEPLFERMLSFESNATDESVRSARRSLAIILAQKQNYQDFQRATALMDQNAAGKLTIETRDIRAMATVLRHSPRPADHLMAIELLEKIDDRRQMNHHDHWQLGKLYLQVGLPEQAGPQFDRAARDGFSDPAFLGDLILHQIQTGALLEAREQIEHLPTTVSPADVVRWRSRYLMAIGQAPVAVQELDAFIDSSTNSGMKTDRLLLGAATCRAALLLGASVNEAALSQAVDRYLRAAVEEDSKHVGDLVQWLLERRRDVEAFELLSVVWQQLPTDTAARLSLDMLRAGANRRRLALVEQHMVEHIHERPASLDSKRCLADVWSLGEKYSEAEELYREILRVDSRYVPALNSLAWNLAMRGRLLDEAMTFAERAIAQAGPVPQLLDTRGCVKLAQSRLRAATDDLTAAAEGENSPTTLLHLAFVQGETGNPDQARQTLAYAVETGLRPERLHPLDRGMLERLNAQLQSGKLVARKTSVDL